MLDSARLELRNDVQLHVFAVTRVGSQECLALAPCPVLNAPTAISILFMLFRERGRPARILLSPSLDLLLARDLRGVTDRLSVSFDRAETTLRDINLYEDLKVPLIRACGNLPRHAALLAIRRAAERWRYRYNARLASGPTAALRTPKIISPPTPAVIVSKPDGILRIEFPRAGLSRIRRIVTRSRFRSTRKIHAFKAGDDLAGGDVEAESPGEDAVYSYLDCDPAVKRIRDQPCHIYYVLDGQEQDHFPDARITPFFGMEELGEFKYKAEAATPEVANRTALMKRCLPEYGFRYGVHIIDDALKEPQRSNREKILSFCTRPVTLIERELMIRECTRADSLTWGNACLGAYGDFGRYILCRLYLEGILSCNLDHPLNESTRFYMRDGGF
jgi:hypothetical protein